MNKASVVFCALLMATGVNAESFKITTDSYTPYTITEGKVTGAFSEIVDAALKQGGHDVSYQVAPWTRAMVMAQEGDVSATMPWFKTPEREANFLYSDPVMDATNKIFIKKNGPVAANLNWNTYADFKPYKFGGVIGYWYVLGFNKAGVTLELVPRDEQNVKKLEAGRIDAFIGDELVSWALIKKMYPGREGEFTTVEKVESTAPLYVLATKSMPGSANFISQLNDGLKKIRASGEYDKIIAKYK